VILRATEGRQNEQKHLICSLVFIAITLFIRPEKNTFRAGDIYLINAGLRKNVLTAAKLLYAAPINKY
jgi:hypothetical protein